MKPVVFTTYYGGSVSVDFADFLRELSRMGVVVHELHGSPYPEMARAEATKSLLDSPEFDVMCLVDQNQDIEPDDVLRMCEKARESGGVVFRDLPHLHVTAISRAALEKLALADDRTYSNSALDTGLGTGARPFFSPWKKSGEWLMPGQYPTEGDAFLHRLVANGVPVDDEFHVERLGGSRAPQTEVYVTNEVPRPGVPRYAVCVASYGPLMLDQVKALGIVEGYGMTIIRVHDCQYIDKARSMCVHEARKLGLDGVFFIDHDVVFKPADIEKLIEIAEERKVVVGGAYCMRKSAHAVIGAIDCKPGSLIEFFDTGDLYPALYTGLGFTAIPMCFFEELDTTLPDAGELKPYFSLDISGTFYCGEDVSFCSRVQKLRVEYVEGKDWKVERLLSGEPRIFIDTRIRLFHRGTYDYGIEDAGIVVPRVSSLQFEAFESREEARRKHILASEVNEALRVKSLEAHGFYEEKGESNTGAQRLET